MTDFIPATWRKPIYAVFAFISLALGATQVGYSSAGADQPLWLTVSMAVYGFVAAGVGATAAANTVKPTAKVEGIPEEPVVPTEALAGLEEPAVRGRHGDY